MSSFSTIEEANDYFDTRLYVDIWIDSDSANKEKSLNDATRIINQFHYKGSKTVASQTNEFPRKDIYLNGDLLDSLIIPNAIIYAQYEFALNLLKGFDPEKEIKSLRVTSRGYSSVRTTYDPKQIPEYLTVGVPSVLGWNYLLPYLIRDNSGKVILHRVS